MSQVWLLARLLVSLPWFWLARLAHWVACRLSGCEVVLNVSLVCHADIGFGVSVEECEPTWYDDLELALTAIQFRTATACQRERDDWAACELEESDT